MSVFEKWFLTIFLVSCILLYGFLVGPFPVRIYATVFMFVYLISQGQFFKVFHVPELRVYLAFVFIFYIILVFNNNIADFNFLKYFLSRYFVCFVAASAVFALVKTKKDLTIVLYILLCIGIANSVLNVLQYFGSANNFYMFLKNTSSVEDFLDEEQLGLNVGTYGLFGNIVTNGYYSATFGVIVWHFFATSKTIIHKFFFLSLLALAIFSSFATQQRLSFTLLIFFVCFGSYRLMSARGKFALTTILLLLLPWLFVIVADVNFGRFDKLSDSNRASLYSYALEFISNNLWLGGVQEYGHFIEQKIGIQLAAHNLFLTAFIYAGLLGGIIIIYLFFRMLWVALKAVKLNPVPTSQSFVFAGCLLVFLGNSLTHNLSLVTGSEFIWIMFVCLQRAVGVGKGVS